MALIVAHRSKGGKEATLRALAYCVRQHTQVRRLQPPGQQKTRHEAGLGYVVGWLMGLEPTTTGITILDSTN